MKRFARLEVSGQVRRPVVGSGRPARLLCAAVSVCAWLCGQVSISPAGGAQPGAESPYHLQTRRQIELLGSATSPFDRAAAAEALGYLRNYSAAAALAEALKDPAEVVRREAAMSLGFCGGRDSLEPLAEALDDDDWVTRQAAWVALGNLTGLELPFDALAEPARRAAQARRWREWIAGVGADGPPKDILELLTGAAKVPAGNLALGAKVTASTTYKGPPGAVTDGSDSTFWQTKNVPFPQHCTIDLGRCVEIGCVVVRQYGPGFCMTDFKLEVSADGSGFEQVEHGRGKSPVRLVISFPPTTVRFIRVRSYASERSIYPTTFREIEVYERPPAEAGDRDELYYRAERGLRALGALGLPGSVEPVIEVVRPYVRLAGSGWAEKAMVQAGITALGRLGTEQSQELLIELLDNPQWARYAAGALAWVDGEAAAEALIAAYPQYARPVSGGKPARCPPDDRPGLEPADRMYETPYAIARSLAQMSWTRQHRRNELAGIAGLLLANLPSDFDGAMLYEPEAHEQVTAYLLERCGLRRAACRAAFRALGVGIDGPESEFAKSIAVVARRRQGGVPNAAHWLPALCRDQEDIPRLIGLLEHKDGWVRINAAKALAFMQARRAAKPIARILAGSKPEAAYGYNGRFFFTQDRHQGQSEYNDPPPRWRQAFARALGLLDYRQSVPLLIRLLWDERNVLEVQTAAARSLDELATPEALAALEKARSQHPFYSIRLLAREALWRRGLLRPEKTVSPASARTGGPELADPAGGQPRAVVFIRGDNNMPNDFQIDHWRQTYSTTDSGPTYRLGRNIMVLEPAEPGGRVRPLTDFADGYVADCEVSWDARRIVFARRGGHDDPWWHIYEAGADGSGLRRITAGPYHDVQPCYLPDGRIVFSTSRLGMRDEYHGYYATGLAVMQPDGSDVRLIGFNVGRDNEPAVLDDGRIVFSRLELFYSRLKTELTVQAAFPDGTHNVTLYGPERRAFWRQVTVRSGEKWWGQVPPRHRVLRLTQPQPYEPGRILCASTAGLVLTGPGRYRETVLPGNPQYALTSPWPMRDGRILCAATERTFDRSRVDLGLYYLDVATGRLTLLYNDPSSAEFEPRPLMPRRRPPVLAENEQASCDVFTARFACQSVRNTQEDRVARRGRFVRVVEGRPNVARHHSHLSSDGPAWKNHAGTFARVLGTVPLAADGSFYIEVPADRLIHLQVLDSDRRVVGNQQIWMYGRGGETRSCVGCHEQPDTTAVTSVNRFPQAQRIEPVECLPRGGEFSYRAKFWNKGTLTDEGEERTRTVRAVNLIASQ